MQVYFVFAMLVALVAANGQPQPQHSKHAEQAAKQYGYKPASEHRPEYQHPSHIKTITSIIASTQTLTTQTVTQTGATITSTITSTAEIFTTETSTELNGSSGSYGKAAVLPAVAAAALLMAAL